MESKINHYRYISQESLLDQLNELIIIANRHGLYDAADWVEKILKDRGEVK